MDKGSIQKEMQSVIEDLKEDLASMRTGRATPALVENVQVSAYGGAQRLRVMELANISAPDPESLVIDPWDKSVIGDIKKGLLAANLGLNPNIDGEVIRIVLPPMTREDREKYVKLLSTKLENSKIRIRQIRGDAMRDIKKLLDDKEIGEDEKHRFEKELQELTDEFTEKIESLGASKEKELLQV